MAAMADVELWTTGDIAARLGISTERARQLTHREEFPEPVGAAKHIRFWRADRVEEWITRHRPNQASPA